LLRKPRYPFPLPITDVEKIEKIRARLGYRSRNDVIREAINRFIEDIEETKAIYIREISLEQAKKEIVEHLRRHGSAYMSEIAEDLGIAIELAFKAVKE
jgi:metal-responsive CopG/Arc/MetJ family transcriptional regulator